MPADRKSYIFPAPAADSLVALLERLGQLCVDFMALYRITGDGHVVMSHQDNTRPAQSVPDSKQTVSCRLHHLLCRSTFQYLSPWVSCLVVRQGRCQVPKT